MLTRYLQLRDNRRRRRRHKMSGSRLWKAEYDSCTKKIKKAKDITPERAVGHTHRESASPKVCGSEDEKEVGER